MPRRDVDLYNVTPFWSESLKENLNAPSAGGFMGLVLNQYLVHRFFGFVGATTIFATIYLVSLVGLTNVSIQEWIRAWRERRAQLAQTGVNPEKALEQRAQDLAKQAKKLQEEVQKAGLGADMQPVPEPTVRDLSVPQSRTGRGHGHESARQPAPAGGRREAPGQSGRTTTADILGDEAIGKTPIATGAEPEGRRPEFRAGGAATTPPSPIPIPHLRLGRRRSQVIEPIRPASPNPSRSPPRP